MKFDFDVDAFANQATEKLVEIAPLLVEILGNNQVANNQLRLDNGIGLDDKKMKLYSKSYEQQRKEKGERVDVRNLVQTGRMRGALALQKVEETSTGATAIIGFSDARARELAFYNQERTAFFGVSPEDGKKLQEIGQQETIRLIGA